jgi:glucosamine--fructose-6-phosphate aminotransferase (isomerizing)
MCGIFGYTGTKDNAKDIILEGLKKLEYRGYDSWGVIIVSKQKTLAVKKKIGKIGQANVEDLPKGRVGLGHTRWATHGGVTVQNAHPHTDCHKRFAVVHNGIVENYENLRLSLKKSHKFISETDTEVLAHLIEEYAETYDFLEAVRKVFILTKGLNAIIVVDKESGIIISAKTGSPVVLAKNADGCFLASDSASLLKYSRELLFLDDGEMAVMDGEDIKIFKAKNGKKLKTNFQKVDWEQTSAKLGKYQHFMLKEIEEQPKVLINTATNLVGEAQKIADLIRNKKIIIIACGSSYNAALYAKYLFKRQAGIDCEVVYASEDSFLNNLSSDSIVIAISQSGETIDIIESVKKIQAQKIKFISLVNVLGSTLYRIADEKVLLGAGSEIGVCATKSFIAQVGFIVLLSYALAGKISLGQKKLLDTQKAIDNIINQSSNIKKLAKKLNKNKNLFVLGRGVSYPAALESALKIKEVSYLHAEGLVGGELKHGPIALIEQNTLCIVLVLRDENYDAIISNAVELRARGAYIIGISSVKTKNFDFWLPISDLGEISSIQQVIYSQYLSYFLAVEKKLDPDKPRNLAKSVTVK